MSLFFSCGTFLAALSTAVLIFGTEAAGSQNCGPRDQVEAAIDSAGESIVFQGLSRTGNVTKIYVSVENGTYSAVANRRDGTSCIVDFGKLISMKEPPVPGKDI